VSRGGAVPRAGGQRGTGAGRRH